MTKRDQRRLAKLRLIEESWRLGGVPSTWPEAAEAARKMWSGLYDALEWIEALYAEKDKDANHAE